MDIRIPPTPPQPPMGSAEQNLLELTKEMINHTMKLKEALEKGSHMLKDPKHLQDVADTVIALDQVSAKAKRVQ